MGLVKKIALLVIIFPFSGYYLFANKPHKIDSLEKLLLAFPEDTSQINNCIELGYAWLDYNLDSVFYYSDRAEELSTKNQNYKRSDIRKVRMIAHYYRNELRACVDLCREILQLTDPSDFKQRGAAGNNLALMYAGLNVYDSAGIYYDSALYYYDLMPEPFLTGYADVYSNKAVLEIELGNPETALKYNFLSLEYLNEEENPRDIAKAYNNIGSLYTQIGELDYALKYLTKSLDLKLIHGMTNSLANTYSLLGSVYEMKGNYTSADSCFQNALKYERLTGNRAQEGSTLNSLANLYLKQGLLQKALTTALASERIKKEFSNENEYYNIRYLLGKIYAEMGEPDSARKEFEFAGAGFRKTGNNLNLVEVLKSQSVIEETLNNDKYALQLAREAFLLSENILNEEKAKSITRLEAKYQNELKEKQIESLSIQSELDRSNIKKQQFFLIIIGGSALILVIILFFTYRYIIHRNKLFKQEQINRKKEQELTSLKSMIAGEEKERSRIAKDLHDGLSGLLAAIKMKLTIVQQESEVLKQNEKFSQSVKALDDSIMEVRRIAHNMVPQILLRYGLVEALGDYLKNIDGVNGIKVDFRHYGMETRPGAQTELVLYRIIQELLTNIIKHSNATEVFVELNRKGDTLMITVEDNGVGFDIHTNGKGDGIGLSNLASRIDFLGGEINFETAPDLGTSVYIEVALKKEVEV